MSGHHLAADRLAALAFGGLDPENGPSEDLQALAHLDECPACAASFSRLLADADGVRALAMAEADAVFDDARLETQRLRILDRLSHIGQAARVIAFPRRSGPATMPVSRSTRRWVSVAAAAGLIIGLLAGQMLHFVPSARPAGGDDRAAVPAAVREASPADGRALLRPASATTAVLDDDELLEEVEFSIRLRRADALRAIDGFTPTAADLLAVR